jgi:hypothetical protein
MNTPPKFEQQLSDWLEAGPVDAPDEILEAVLGALPSIPQRRAALRLLSGAAPRIGSLRGLIELAAVVALAVGALLVLPRLLPGSVGGPTAVILTSPSLSPSPSAPAESSSPSPSFPAGGSSPSPSPSPSPSASPSGPAQPQDCQGSDLAARVMDWQGAAGTRFGTIRVQNTGATSCLVSGTPGIQLVDGQDRVFLDSATWGEPASVAPAKPILTLRAGGADSLYLMAGLTNYCGADPTSPVRIALVLPAGLGRVVATAPTDVVITMAPCNGPTLPTVLHLQVPWSTTPPQ